MNDLYVPQLVKVKIHLNPSDLGYNYEKKIADRIAETYGNRCYINGFIKKSSIKIVNIGTGRREGSHLHGFLTFNVEFSALFCIPKKDIVIPCRVMKVNKFGVMAHAYPIDVIVPRQLQAMPGNDIEKLKNLHEGDNINVRTLQYTIEHNRLVVVGYITDIMADKPNSIELQPDGIELPYHINLQFSPQKPIQSERLGTNQALNRLKEKITPYKGIWNIIKGMINPYELVDRHLTKGRNYIKYNNFTDIYSPDSLYPVITRAYFKLWEILSDTKVLEPYRDQAIKIANLAEGPGGFIQCLIDFRNHQHGKEWANDAYFAITIKQDSDQPKLKNVQDWDNYQEGKSYFDLLTTKGYQIKRSYGQTGDGDLLNVTNLHHFSQLVGEDKCHIITGDGGIYLHDEEYGTQEYDNAKLFFAEILTALYNQANGGTLILKIYDVYYDLTVQILDLLSIYYHQVLLIKPRTSRPANSEKYVVCCDFRGIEVDQLEELTTLFVDWLKLDKNQYGILLLDLVEKPESQFIKNITDFNQYNTDLQMEKINEGLNLATGKYRNPHTKEEYLNGQKSALEKWCQQYHLPYVK